MSDPVTIARTAWGSEIPDWVLRLAEACAASSQNKVAAKLGRSASLVSHVLNANYRGDMVAVEDLVRGHYMSASIECPVNGVISTAVCRDWMQLARSFSNINSERVRMYRACRACARMKKEAVE